MAWGSGYDDADNARKPQRGNQVRDHSTFNNRGFRSDKNYNSLKLFVDSKSVGKIIGKGGSHIRDIRSSSGAIVNISRKQNSVESKTEIEIFGSDEAIEKAKNLILDTVASVRDVNPSTKYDSYGGRRDDYEDEKPLKFNSASEYSKENSADVKPTINWKQAILNSQATSNTHWSSLAPIKKDFYFEDPEVSALTEKEVEAIRSAKNEISVEDHNPSLKRKVFNPVLNFEQAFGHYDEILKVIEGAGFTEPSPIQSQAWPLLLSGYDLIGIAQTGTGKTLAFLLPALIHIDQQEVPREERVGPTCLILSPTRELAKQIEEEVSKFSYRGIRSCCIYGGGDRRSQINKVEAGVEIVIATPGRLNDLYANKIICMDSVTFLVLDEADRMLDMGFEAEIKKFLLDIRPDRHTVMTSATWPPAVRRLAKGYMTDPMQVNVGSLDLSTCHTITQMIEFMDGEAKLRRVKQFVCSELKEDEKVLIFVGKKVTADYVCADFVIDNIHDGRVQCIHGDREQVDRESALADFKDGVARILIATDVASRGLDINNINYVVNYDFPRHIEEYVHRIGRTGRAGKTGIALTFMTREDWSHARSLIELLKEANQVVPNDLIAMAERFDEKQRQRELNVSDNRTAGSSRSCFKCGMTGHISRFCKS